jgi:hypothetical protein
VSSGSITDSTERRQQRGGAAQKTRVGVSASASRSFCAAHGLIRKSPALTVISSLTTVAGLSPLYSLPAPFSSRNLLKRARIVPVNVVAHD